MIAAAIAGATTGAIDALTNGDVRGAMKTASAGAVVGALMYLKTHPPVPTDSPAMPRDTPQAQN